MWLDPTIHERAREIATEMVETGEHRRIVNSVAAADKKAGIHVANNIVALATGSDDAPVDEWRSG